MNATNIFFTSITLGMLDTILLSRSASTLESCILACLLLSSVLLATTAAEKIR